ncbi:NAD-dependent epimerase/dehydratase family protein [Salimicrobium sp. PL1-032A]|uniref:NAD-dependent epimerase/dehydratase family protein n=1 Tax=Salimicrobium sp. PL1-032A TaxID=3095364 RepID=UPI0032602E8F
MKRILITGKNSYVGNSFEEWINKSSEDYIVDKISLRDDSWKEKSFKAYDTILHTVGIAHVNAKQEMENDYYKINRDLAIETAQKAKDEGVGHFVFLSSVIVYGDSSPSWSSKIIDENTVPTPANFYGESKLQAEQGLRNLEDEDFRVSIVRPPMVYGRNSKGNYPKLSKLAKLTPVFPDVENRRSVIFIDNLSEFLRLLISFKDRGTFHPQNGCSISTSDLVKTIAQAHGKKVVLSKSLGRILKLFERKSSYVTKVFGNMEYASSISEHKHPYQTVSFHRSIFLTET